jgi:hypothetical protein
MLDGSVQVKSLSVIPEGFLEMMQCILLYVKLKLVNQELTLG